MQVLEGDGGGGVDLVVGGEGCADLGLQFRHDGSVANEVVCYA